MARLDPMTAEQGSTEAPDDLDRIRRFLSPQRVAVVGASRDESSIGGVLLGNLREAGFAGDIYPVHPEAGEIQGLDAYPSIAECPEVPDLALIVVPAKIVLQVVEEAGQAGVPAVCVISAGFGETGSEGRRHGQELLEIVRRHGMRMVGPNCMGLTNAAESVRLNATFSHTFPAAGRVGMLSQSGAVGLLVLDHAEEFQLGLSSFVSVGNQLDVCANDLLPYWEQDGDTDVLLLYLESIGSPDVFRRHASRIARQKPIVVVKSGRTEAGERAASSHTAAVAGQDRVADALFVQSGVIRAQTLRAMFETTEMLTTGRIPGGRRVGIITNGGGPGILAADACAAAGLEVPAWSEATRQELAALLPAEASAGNPVDLLAGADAEVFERVLRIAGSSQEVDMLLVLFIPPIVTDASEVAQAVARAQDELVSAIPIVAVFMGRNRRPQQLIDASIPAYAFPEDAAGVLGQVARWAEWCRQPTQEPVRPAGVDPDRGRATIRRAYSEGSPDPEQGLWMTTWQAAELLDAYGIPFASFQVVVDAEEAAEAQRAIAAPVALKLDAPIHKTDVGGVVLGCETPEQAAEAVSQIRHALEQAGESRYAGRYLVQEMLGDGVELALGMRTDPSFGPVLMVGLGGEWLELLGDVCVRLPPLTDGEARAMLESLAVFPLLTGYRGRPARDVEALLDLIHRLGALALDQPEIAELDLNPVFVQTEGVRAADVRLRLRAPELG